MHSIKDREFLEDVNPRDSIVTNIDGLDLNMNKICLDRNKQTSENNSEVKFDNYQDGNINSNSHSNSSKN